MPSRTFICQVLCLPRVSLPHHGFERLAWFPISVLTRISIETCTLDSYFPPIPSPNSASSFFHIFSSLCLLSTQTWNLDSFCFFVSCQILQAQSKVKSRQNSFVGILLDIFFFFTLSLSSVPCRLSEGLYFLFQPFPLLSPQPTICFVFHILLCLWLSLPPSQATPGKEPFFSHFLLKNKSTFPCSHLFFLLWPMHLAPSGLLWNFAKQIVSLKRILVIRFWNKIIFFFPNICVGAILQLFTWPQL